MKNVWRIFLLLMVLNNGSLISSEPQYQQQQNQFQPQDNFNNNNNNNNNNNVNNQANNNNQYNGPQQQQPLQQQQQQAPYRYRAPAPPATTAAPSFFQRITSWFNFFGDDSGDRRPLQPPAPPQRQSLSPNPPPLPPPQLQPQQFQHQQQFQPQPQLQPQQQFQPQLQLQPQQQLQAQPIQQLVQFPQPQQIDPVKNGSRIGVVNSNYGPPNFINQQQNGGFQPIVHQNHNYQTSGSNYHPVANALPPANNIQGPGYQYQPPPQPPQQPQQPFVPSTLQQKIVGSQQDPRILRPSQAYHQNQQLRDPEPTTINPGVAPVPGGPNTGPFEDFDYHPCNNVPWVPLEPPPEHPPVTQFPPNAITPPSQTPIKLEIRPKGHVHSVSPYPPSIQNHESAIITAAPQDHLIQLQLQHQQQQLQNLQLQQLQLQQQQLQQQLQQLKVSTPVEALYPPTTTTSTIQAAAPTIAHFVTRKPDPPAVTAVPITFRQVAASYFTNKDYHPPAKILPIQNEDKPHASISLPNLSASPVPPLYTATSFHADPYKFYRPHKPRDIVELGIGYPQSLQSMSNSYIRYNRPPFPGNRQNHSIFDVEQVASSSSQVYTTVAYNNEDSKPAASEHRNVTITGTNQLTAEDDDYSSEEDDDQISGVTVTFPVEVTSVVPKTRYYSSRTTTTERPTTFPSSLPPPTDPEELGNGLHIIYSANLHSSSPNNKHFERKLPDSDIDHTKARPPVSLFNNLLTEEDPEDSVARETAPITVSTHAPPTRAISTLLTTLKIAANRPTIFQRYTTTEVPSTEITTPIPHTVTTAPATTSLHHSSMTAAIGGHINTAATKKPKQIQIIIPYSTYKKPEPFKPKDRDEIDHSPEESKVVTATTGSSSTPSPLTSRFVTRESMKFYHSTSNIKDILRKETTRPFSRPPTTIPEKPTKLKKVEPVKISKDSKPFTLPRVPKMTPMPPIFNLSGLTADHRLERTTTAPPRTFRPTIIMAHPSRFAPHYINITRMRPIPTSQMFSHRTTISQLLRTTKIVTNPPKSREEHELLSRPLTPIVYRRTTVPTTTSTDRPETTPIPIYERNEWDIDPLLLQRRIDTWTEQQYASDDYLFKSSTIPLHRVTKAIPWEFLTTTMLPSLRDRVKGRDSWRNVKIAISPLTKEKVYVVTPQPWTAIINQETVSSPRFSIRPTPFYQRAGSTSSSISSRRSGSTGSTVDVSPESVNDLVEHKSKLHRTSLSPAKLKHRKYVRQKTFTRTPYQARFSSTSSSDESA